MANTPLGNKALIRALNRSTVLNIVKSKGPIARAEVARRTGLSPATVTSITAELIEDNLIFEKAPGDSSGGRRPILMALNPKGGYVVGIKLTETQLIGALTDLEANVVARCSLAWAGRTQEQAVQVMASLINTLVSQGNIRKKQLLGLGIGLAGIIDANRGLLRRTPFFDWHDLPLRDLIQAHLRIPVYLDNDVNTLTLAEKWFGAGQGVNNFLTVTIGRGVGMGIVLNGQFYRGANGGAGELGHTVIDPAGPLCPCGKRGCLEAYIGDLALLRAAADAGLGDQANSPDGLVILAQAGNPIAQSIFSQAGEKLGRGIANLINLLSPDLIIIGGEGTRAGELIFDPMRKAMASYVLDGLGGVTTLRIERWGDDAWARGAASLVLRELFESPVHREGTPADV